MTNDKKHKCPDCGAAYFQGDEICDTCSADLTSGAAQGKKDGREKIVDGIIADLKPQLAITVPMTHSVEQTIKLMRERKMGCVLVNKGGQLAGIFTERDVLMKIAGQKDPAKTVISDVMKADPQYLKEGDSIAFAFHNMAINNYRHIPIMRTDGSYGIISLHQ